MYVGLRAEETGFSYLFCVCVCGFCCRVLLGRETHTRWTIITKFICLFVGFSVGLICRAKRHSSFISLVLVVCSDVCIWLLSDLKVSLTSKWRGGVVDLAWEVSVFAFVDRIRQ